MEISQPWDAKLSPDICFKMEKKLLIVCFIDRLQCSIQSIIVAFNKLFRIFHCNIHREPQSKSYVNGHTDLHIPIYEPYFAILVPFVLELCQVICESQEHF